MEEVSDIQENTELKLQNTGYIQEKDTLISNLTNIPTVLPSISNIGVLAVQNLNKEATLLEEGAIQVREQSVDEKVNPDFSTIKINHINSPIEVIEDNKEDVKITDIFIRSQYNAPIGIILLRPDKNILTAIWDPLKDGGTHGFTIDKGWTLQILVPDNSVLELMEYWSPRGYSDPDGEGNYGEHILNDKVNESTLPDEFITRRNILKDTLNTISEEREKQYPNVKLDPNL